MENTDIARIASAVSWLEEQQQNAHSLLTRLQQQMDQAVAMSREIGLVMRGNGDDIEHLKAQLARVTGAEEAIRRLQEQVSRLCDAESAQAALIDRLEHHQQADGKRLNQAFVEVRRLVDPLPDAIESLANKLTPLSEGLRRQQDSLADLQKNSDLLTSEHRSFSSRLQSVMDQLKRAEQEIGEIRDGLEPLRQQDDALMARTQMLTDKVKQLADQYTAFQEFHTLYRDLLERAQLQKAEHHALEGRLTGLSQTVAEQGELLQESMRLIKGLDDRLRSEAATADERHREATKRWEKVLSVLEDYQELAQSQRERKIAELQQQLRELKELAVWREAIL